MPDWYEPYEPREGDAEDSREGWPVFKDMFNDGTYEGPPGPWNPADHPDDQEYIEDRHVKNNMGFLGKRRAVNFPFR